jgi:hypothetical protein
MHANKQNSTWLLDTINLRPWKWRKFVRNVGELLLDCKPLHPRTEYTSAPDVRTCDPQRPAILVQIFPQSLQGYAGTVPRFAHGRFLPNPFQFISHVYSNHSTLSSQDLIAAGFCFQHTRANIFIPEMTSRTEGPSSGRLAVQAITRGHTSDVQT